MKKLFNFRIKRKMTVFWIVALMAIITLQVIYAVNTYLDYLESISSTNNQYIEFNPNSSLFSAFTIWIGGNSSSLFSKIFYLFPFIVATSLEYKISENNIKSYVRDYATTFLVSGLTVIIPLLCNFLLVMAFVPVIYPDSVYDIYYGLFSNSFMGEMFYTMPFLYISIFIFLNFMFYGLVGGVCFSLYYLTRNRLLSICIPPFSLLTFHLAEYFQKGVVMINKQELSPLIYLNPARSRHTSWTIIITEFILLLLISIIFGIFGIKMQKKKSKG